VLPKVFFAYFSVMITILSLLVITRRNPVHSILFMLGLFFHIAALYVFLNAEFIAAIQVIVYAGAILVLFLFVVMMLNLREEMLERRYIGAWPVGALLSVTILFSLFSALKVIPQGPAGRYGIEAIKSETHTAALGKILYTEYLFPFEVASVVLLVAIIGAIVLAKKRIKT